MNKDFQFCSGRGCLFNHDCKRYHKTGEGCKQYFYEPPFRIVNDFQRCDLYVSNGGVNLVSLIDIFTGDMPPKPMRRKSDIITASMPKFHNVTSSQKKNKKGTKNQ